MIIPAQRSGPAAFQGGPMGRPLAAWFFEEIGETKPRPAWLDRMVRRAPDVRRRYPGHVERQYDALYGLAAVIVRPHIAYLTGLGEEYARFARLAGAARGALQQLGAPPDAAARERVKAGRRLVEDSLLRLSIMETGMVETVRYLVPDRVALESAAAATGLSARTLQSWVEI